jgi:signal transduction histidine kinase
MNFVRVTALNRTANVWTLWIALSVFTIISRHRYCAAVFTQMIGMTCLAISLWVMCGAYTDAVADGAGAPTAGASAFFIYCWFPVSFFAGFAVYSHRHAETRQRAAFRSQVLNTLLQKELRLTKTKIAQLALEKERTLRHEAEYRLQFEKKLTSFVCRELQIPFTTMKSATRFVVNGLQQTRQSSVPPVDWSSRLGSLLEWCVPIIESSTYISDFLGNVLDLSRIEEGALHLSDEPVYLAPIAGKVKERVHGALLERRGMVQFQSDIDPSLCVTGDAARIEQVLTILVESALERTTVGFVRLSARVSKELTETGGQQLLLEVADTGTGIRTEQVPFLFVRRTPGMRPEGRVLQSPGERAPPTLPTSGTRALCDQLSMAASAASQPRAEARADNALRLLQESRGQESRGTGPAGPADPEQAKTSSSGLGLVLAHQIVRLWGSSAGLQVCSPAWTQEQRARLESENGRRHTPTPAAPAAPPPRSGGLAGRRLGQPRQGSRQGMRRLEVMSWGAGSIFSFQVPIAVLCLQPMSEGEATRATGAAFGSSSAPAPAASQQQTPLSAPVSEPACHVLAAHRSSSMSEHSSTISTQSPRSHDTHHAQKASEESEV